VLVQADFNALEWRVPVSLSRDKVGIEELLNKRDVHTANQDEFNLPTRLISKKYLFRTIFRGSGWAFANDPEFSHVSDSPDYWDAVNHKFYTKYKGVDQWHTKLAQFVTAHQPIIGPTGRSWFIEMGPPDRFGLPKIPWNTLTNYPVQGTAADIVAVARISCYNRFKKLKIDGKLQSTIHDSIVADVQDKEVERTAKLMYDVANDLNDNFKKLFNFDLIIPFPVEVKVGPNMTDMEKLLEENL
jgi:DNA polymerase-1